MGRWPWPPGEEAVAADPHRRHEPDATAPAHHIVVNHLRRSRNSAHKEVRADRRRRHDLGSGIRRMQFLGRLGHPDGDRDRRQLRQGGEGPPRGEHSQLVSDEGDTERQATPKATSTRQRTGRATGPTTAGQRIDVNDDEHYAEGNFGKAAEGNQ
jgi:hypothetical protein